MDLNQLWERLKQISGVDIPVNYGPARKGDVQDSLADIDKARRLLGYDPLFPMSEGLRVTWEEFVVRH
jgi:UDP-N-acetylglucosamine/UDP-N-acetyl-alpha-D-glucosaminouronate 4-epimerase